MRYPCYMRVRRLLSQASEKRGRSDYIARRTRLNYQNRFLGRRINFAVTTMSSMGFVLWARRKSVKMATIQSEFPGQHSLTVTTSVLGFQYDFSLSLDYFYETFKDMRIVVTGAAGSGGSYLLEALTQSDPRSDYIAWIREDSPSQLVNLTSVRNRVELVTADLNDFDAVVSRLEALRPDAIYHFASRANVSQSFRNPRETLSNNVQSTLNLLEGLRQLDMKPRVLMCSTSEVYGQVHPNEVPLKETSPIRPASPYAVSKVAQDLLSQVYFRSYGLPVIVTRMFSYFNPRRHDLFATAFALQIARIELGLQSELVHGNLDSVRTIIDIRDAMDCYIRVMEKGVPGEVYNLGGEATFQVGEILKHLIKRARCKIPTRVDPSLLRPTDVTLQIPDTSKFLKLGLWKPRYTFEESLDHLLAECRQHTAQQSMVL